jgi:hypothetical protein
VSAVAILMTEDELEALVDRRIEARLLATGITSRETVASPARDLLLGYSPKRDVTNEEVESDELWARRVALQARQLAQVGSVLAGWLSAHAHPREREIRARLSELDFNGNGDFYFFKPTPGDLIKIGSSLNVPERLRTIKSLGGLSRVDCVAFGPGGFRVERFLHYVFRETREDGEWFRPTAPMVALIEQFAATKWVWE